MGELVDRVGRSRSEEGDRWVYRFANGLVVHTDPFLRREPDRILPLGGPQDTILSRMLHSPELVRDRRVLEPFAGSGAFGLMALKLGARHVDFVDVNPRACVFQRENAVRNGFAPDRYTCHLASITDYASSQPYDTVLANPPFVPTPPGVPGTLTSAGGPEGSDLAEALFVRLGELLRPEGEAFVYLMQLASPAGPLVATGRPELVTERTATFTPTQESAIPFADYVASYRQCFPRYTAEIDRWSTGLGSRHGDELGVQHYVVHVGPARPGPSRWAVAGDLREEYGVEPYPAADNARLALGRVMENVVPSAD